MEVLLTEGLLGNIRELSTLVSPNESLDDAVRYVSKLAVRAIPGCQAAGATIIERGQPATAGASDEWVLEVDRHQYASGEGPCLAAMQQHETLVTGNLPEDDRWPTFAKNSVTTGLMSLLSTPLEARGTSHGSLNMYSKEVDAFTDEDGAVAALFAIQAGVAIVNHRTLDNALKLTEHLQEALKTREVIGEAKGILIAQEGVTGDEAFEMLKRVSQTSNVKLRDIAQELVDRVQKQQKSNSR